MAGLLLYAVLGALAAVGIVAAGRLTRSTSPQAADDATVPVEVRRTTTAWRWSGVAVGATIAVISANWGPLGSGLLLAAPLFGLFVLLGVLVGEFSVSAPADSPRRAALTVRRARDYLPRRLTPAVILATGALTVLLAATTAMGSADDMGQAGRSLARQCSPVSSESHGPWAGSFYSIPLAVVVLLGLVAAMLALRRLVRRPRPGNPLTLTPADDLLRRRSAHVVTGACGVLIAIPLIGVTGVTAYGLLSISCRPSSWTLTAWLLIAAIPVWVALLAWSGLAVFSASRLAATVETAR